MVGREAREGANRTVRLPGPQSTSLTRALKAIYLVANADRLSHVKNAQRLQPLGHRV